MMVEPKKKCYLMFSLFGGEIVVNPSRGTCWVGASSVSRPAAQTHRKRDLSHFLPFLLLLLSWGNIDENERNPYNGRKEEEPEAEDDVYTRKI